MVANRANVEHRDERSNTDMNEKKPGICWSNQLWQAPSDPAVYKVQLKTAECVLRCMQAVLVCWTT